MANPSNEESADVERLESPQAALYPAGLPAPKHFIALTAARTLVLVLLILMLVAVAFATGYLFGRL
jgi:hypothetical protein